LIHRRGADAVGINGRDHVQRCEREAGAIIRQLIQRAIGSKSDAAACAGLSIAYQSRSGRGEVDGVQPASGTKRVRGDPIEHASARLEAQVAHTERRPVLVNHAYGGNQAARIGIDLDQRAGVATDYSCSKQAAVRMEGKPAQARACNRRANECAAAIDLIDADQRAPIQCAVAIAALHRQGWCAAR